MTTKTLDCPTIGLTYTECVTDFSTYYTLAPDADHKMRVKSMEFANEDGTIEPQYLSRIAFPAPYDFAKNERGIEAE